MALIFEKGNKKQEKQQDLPKHGIASELLRDEIGLPNIDEQTLVRHYTALSRMNFGVDTDIYPLGSCTMKYNPKINEKVAANEKFLNMHPYMLEHSSQGCLKLMYDLNEMLKELVGLPHMTLAPSAGAHGELTGVKIIRAYHKSRGNNKTKIIVPDTAHGTNPASCALTGYKVLGLKTDGDGVVTPNRIEEVLDDDVAGLMMTNPNTLGLFEAHIKQIADMLHKRDALLYCDGANFNALLGKARFGDMGVDIIHINLHKTFSTPHGGGGPGSGPVGVCEKLKDFLPNSIVVHSDSKYSLKEVGEKSIGLIKSFYGNFSIFIRAYAYLKRLGAEGVRRVSETALLNANYIRASLKDYYHIPYEDSCMHEVILSDKNQKQFGISTLDIAKRLIDKGFHPPTIYFPLVVPGAMMIEPVETESKEAIDKFINAMIEIAKEAKENPELLKEAPMNAPRRRIDEVSAARKPILTYDEGI